MGWEWREDLKLFAANPQARPLGLGTTPRVFPAPLSVAFKVSLNHPVCFACEGVCLPLLEFCCAWAPGVTSEAQSLGHSKGAGIGLMAA